MDSIFELLLEFVGSIFGLMGSRLRFILVGFVIMLFLVSFYLIWN